MNKKDKDKLCSIIAEMEWLQGGSAGEAVGRSNFCERLIAEFDLTEDDLEFHRVWNIYTNCCPLLDNQLLFDCIDGAITTRGYKEIVDTIDAKGFEHFAREVVNGS